LQSILFKEEEEEEEEVIFCSYFDYRQYKNKQTSFPANLNCQRILAHDVRPHHA
jgi:hypothetical protein